MLTPIECPSRLTCAKTEAALAPLAEAAEVGARLGHLGEDAFGVREELFAGLCEDCFFAQLV